MRETIEQQVGHINGVFGSMAGSAVRYFNQSMPREELAALYRAADVMLVTPYRDGMNLVAKEYVAARGDLGGALVLSEFAGAAAELKQAFLVNPHDIAGVKSQLVRALRMDPAEGAKRMRAMRRHLYQERPRPLGELLLRCAARAGRRAADRSRAAALEPLSPAGGARDERLPPSWTPRSSSSRPAVRCWSPATTTACWPRWWTTRRRRCPSPASPRRWPGWPPSTA